MKSFCSLYYNRSPRGRYSVRNTYYMSANLTRVRKKRIQRAAGRQLAIEKTFSKSGRTFLKEIEMMVTCSCHFDETTPLLRPLMNERERDGKRRGRRTICPVASINFQFRDCLPRGTSASLNWKRSGDERSEKVELPWISIDEFDLFDAVGKVAIMTRIN